MTCPPLPLPAPWPYPNRIEIHLRGWAAAAAIAVVVVEIVVVAIAMVVVAATVLGASRPDLPSLRRDYPMYSSHTLQALRSGRDPNISRSLADLHLFINVSI